MRNGNMNFHNIESIETYTDSGGTSEWRGITLTDDQGDVFRIGIFSDHAIPDIIDRDAEAEQTLQNQQAQSLADDTATLQHGMDDNGCDRN